MVAVLVALGLVHLQREVMAVLPAIRDTVVVAILGSGQTGQRQQRKNAERGHQQRS